MNRPSKNFSTRYNAAKEWRSHVEGLIEEAFKFCAPGRRFDFDSKSKQVYESDVFTSLGEELASDLAGDLVSYFTPPEAIWASYAVISEVARDDAQLVKRLVSERETALFDMIHQSNYNDIAPQWGFEAATHGTAALWVTAGAIGQPVHCEIVPPHELFITPGHMGKLDRFRETTVPAWSVETLLQDYNPTFADETKRKLEKPGAFCDVTFGYWLDWSDPNRPQWACEVLVDKKRVTEEEMIIGDIAGACPLLVGRFNPQPGRPWGRGCAIKALPDLRTADVVEDSILAGINQALHNTLIYPDDGILDMTEGLEPGRAYPAGRGFTKDQIWDMPRQVNLDYGYYTQKAFEERIRMSFYQDGPRQSGDTPPTATQWVDERRRIQQRIGKPSAPLWSELILPLIQRFEYLGVTTGRMPEAISHDGANILVQPISPLQKAQNSDRIMVFRSNLDTLAGVLGEQALNFIDPIGSLSNLIEVSGDKIMVLRKAERESPDAPQG